MKELVFNEINEMW